MVLENETKNPGGDQGIRPMPARGGRGKMGQIWPILKNVLKYLEHVSPY